MNDTLQQSGEALLEQRIGDATKETLRHFISKHLPSPRSEHGKKIRSNLAKRSIIFSFCGLDITVRNTVDYDRLRRMFLSAAREKPPVAMNRVSV